ncbi:division cycle protein 123 [Seminavis robusta]|uniref:Division cycle protein 123 n=1 Tax=Seminavis robusta TaxID=568900 RepID=A0A9N8HB61_9STRA|nr:division cycle protein 123 [Seminavis robusta]|eukprot:Sro349_g123500.1 division cycle protein 123 (190) ;mRNA; r:43096-43665
MAAPATTTTEPTNISGGGNPLPLEASCEELLECQFSSWFPTFRHLDRSDCDDRRSNVTIKSQLVSPLPADFSDFLLADGIRLPEGATRLSSCAPNEQEQQPDDSSCDDQQSNDSEQKQFSFPQLNQQIEEAIEALGGSVVPKLNWSAPKDATWVNEGTLKCKTPGDVYLLLKSSDFCLHDWQVFQENIY